MSREEFDGVQWENVLATAALLEAAVGRIGMKGKGANKTLHGLSLDDDPGARDFIGQIADGLGCRVADGSVSGLELPVKVAVS